MSNTPYDIFLDKELELFYESMEDDYDEESEPEEWDGPYPEDDYDEYE